jgi:uncharacterized protein with HEPN domain
MSPRPSTLLLDEMLAAIARIERYVAGLDQARFAADDKTADAVARNLEVLGEAAARLPLCRVVSVSSPHNLRFVGCA